jgi:hypothetical protein
MFKDRIIVTDHPTQEMLDAAHKEDKMVFTFIYKPESIIDEKTSKSFLEDWLNSLKLKPDVRLALILVDPRVDMDYCIKFYIESLEDSVLDKIKFPRFSNI